MNEYVTALATWGGPSWQDEMRRARDDGYISCQECGHVIGFGLYGPEMHDEQGCHEFDGSLDFVTEGSCPCPNRFTEHDIAAIWRNYGKLPYVVGAELHWHGDPEDICTVIGFSLTSKALRVRWHKNRKPDWVQDPVQDLAEIAG